MRKLIFIIAVCMLYHNAYGAVIDPGADSCPAGKAWVLGSGSCVVCPDNTYQDSDSYRWYECKPCPAGTTAIGDTAADHDSIDDCIAVSVSCMPGYYLPAGSATCTQCPKIHIARAGNIHNLVKIVVLSHVQMIQNHRLVQTARMIVVVYYILVNMFYTYALQN